MEIVIFSGTSDGRLLARELSRRGTSAKVFVATEYGAEEQGEMDNITVNCGRLKAEEMALHLSNDTLCIDATHPYAVLASTEIKKACELTGAEYLRLCREKSSIPESKDLILKDSAAEAADFLRETEGNILLACGAKEIEAFREIPAKRLFPRILPNVESLKALEKLEIPHRNIIAMQGPFSREMNEATIRQYNIRWFVSKDSGKAGGFEEKLEAVKNTGIKAVIIKRPLEIGTGFEEILRLCQSM
ncbi:MAG: precorrin-6A reductase [Clostridiales bacterium]|nr:precorrin-6A reductase [Clostridiales bacterium]